MREGVHRRAVLFDLDGTLLDTAADLYGQHVAVDFVARIRGQEKFASVEKLIDAMGRDTEKARAILSKP
jgi:riboflavin kinase/FMN adenylyltransferase